MVTTVDDLAAYSEAIEKRLDLLTTPPEDAPHQMLYEAARYSLFSGGKRMRPLLTLATATGLGAPLSHALDSSCAVEMIHTYSMIHDDLPAMDDDAMRRGKPTLHCVVPEGIAILAGDWLLTYAFEVLTNAPLTETQKLSSIQILANRAGGIGMIGGQALDLASEGKRVNIETVYQFHYLKTAKLIKTSLLLGAIAADGKKDLLEEIDSFGDTLGIAFQIQDDIRDVTDGEGKHGVEGGTDILRNKATYVTLLGKMHAQEELYAAKQKALKKLADLPFNTTLLEAITKKILYL